MKILLLYGTTQGQTRKIMRHIADRLAAQNHSVELVPADQATGLGTDRTTDRTSDRTADRTGGLDPTRFDAAILAGSLHAGRYQSELLKVTHAMAPALNRLPGLFLSVSLTAAGDEPAERAELERLARGFLTDTGWDALQIAQVAGALRFSAYGFFEYWAMLWISRQKNRTLTGREDIEFTDWPALDALTDAFITRAAGTEQAGQEVASAPGEG